MTMKSDLIATAKRLREQADRLRQSSQSNDNAQDFNAARDCERRAEQMEKEASSISSDAAQPLVSFDLIAHLHRQREFSQRTFGPGARVQGLLDHLRKELVEVEEFPGDIEEWVDVVLLALDGAWRAGYEPIDIALAITEKQARNEARIWPDWRDVPEGKAIEHVRN